MDAKTCRFLLQSVNRSETALIAGASAPRPDFQSTCATRRGEYPQKHKGQDIIDDSVGCEKKRVSLVLDGDFVPEPGAKPKNILGRVGGLFLPPAG